MTNQENKNFLRNIWNAKGAIILSGFIGAMIFFVISAIIPPSYKAFASVAINQTRTGGLDAYREAKSSEFIARNIKEMIMANSFMRTVTNSQYINWEEMNNKKTQDEKIKFWRKKVKVAVIPNTGVLHISVYTHNRDLSKQVAEKIVWTLKDKKEKSFASKGIKLEIIDDPYYFYKPAFPNLLINTLIGFIVGSVLTTVLIVVGGEEKRTGLKINMGLSKKKNKYIELSKADIIGQI